jgi:hypothetical protein
LLQHKDDLIRAREHEYFSDKTPIIPSDSGASDLEPAIPEAAVLPDHIPRLILPPITTLLDRVARSGILFDT